MPELSGPEKDLLDMILLGTPNKRIALRLGVCVRTVETHRSRLMRKLGANSPANLGYRVAIAGYRVDTRSEAAVG